MCHPNNTLTKIILLSKNSMLTSSILNKMFQNRHLPHPISSVLSPQSFIPSQRSLYEMHILLRHRKLPTHEVEGPTVVRAGIKEEQEHVRYQGKENTWSFLMTYTVYYPLLAAIMTPKIRCQNDDEVINGGVKH